ncbi:hypothetical protein [Luteolibacter soli]|uniref:Uncharacterized protein n=1 Tax=Luteolibacter soli TaxID=3135280 RepID=A0ABU9AYJ6_9BACT
MTLPAVLTNWKMVLLLVLGIVPIGNGIRIWIRKSTRVADPFLWGPLTGGIGCFIVGFLYSDEQITGFPARMVALFQMFFGTLMLAMFFFLGVWPVYFAKQPPREAEPAREMAYLPADGSAPAAPIIPPDAPPVAAVQPTPVAGQAPPATAAPRTPEKPGTIERMSKDWKPEGIQLRPRP